MNAGKWLWVSVVSFCFVLAGCGTPGTIPLPSDHEMAAHRIPVHDIRELPPAVTRVMAGDTLRIVRDAQIPPERDDTVLFPVRPDGSFAYPEAGLIHAQGKTPEEVGQQIRQRLAKIYREPAVTVNIASAPGNKIYVGGAVRKSAAFDLASAVTLDQAIIAAGGVLPSADSHHVALLRMGDDGLYQVYFSHFNRLLQPSAKHQIVMLQPGDVVFVPTSAAGNAAAAVDLYLNQMIPFTKYIGIGINYAPPTP